jgi:fatty acid desaturase
MKVEIQCPSCGRRHDIESDLVGQTVTCECGDKFVAQLQPPKPLQAPSAPIAPSTLPDTDQEARINGRIQFWFWIGIVAVVLLIVWLVVWRPQWPKPPGTVSLGAVRKLGA